MYRQDDTRDNSPQQHNNHGPHTHRLALPVPNTEISNTMPDTTSDAQKRVNRNAAVDSRSWGTGTIYSVGGSAIGGVKPKVVDLSSKKSSAGGSTGGGSAGGSTGTGGTSSKR